MSSLPVPFALPRLRDIVRRSFPAIVESSLVPFALFAGSVRLIGPRFALFVALGWSLLAIARRHMLGKRISALLLLSTLALTIRTVFALASGSLTLYFMQPQLTSVVVAGAFAASVPVGRPLAWRLANDFIAMPSHGLSDPVADRAFGRLSFLWAGLHLTKAAANLWSFHFLSLSDYTLAKGGISLVVMGGGLGFSLWWLRRALHRLTSWHATEASAATAV